MLYIIGLLRKGYDATGEIIRYTLIDTLSESSMRVNSAQLKNIINNCGTQVVNARIQRGQIELKNWVNKITVELSGDISNELIDVHSYKTPLAEHRCNNILLAKQGDTYKMTRYYGNIQNITLNELRMEVSRCRVANCSFKTGPTQIKVELDEIDTYEIETDTEFEESIKIKYDTFQSKVALLGYRDMSFDYVIENKQVKLLKYTGSGGRIILPSFITTVMERAFKGIVIEELDLNEGLKTIGKEAFDPGVVTETLKSIEIPSTVELIETEAFVNNIKLCNRGTLNTTRFKLRNSSTVVLGMNN